jgi:hypothetical protein
MKACLSIGRKLFTRKTPPVKPTGFPSLADCYPGIDPGIMQKPIHAENGMLAPASFFDDESSARNREYSERKSCGLALRGEAKPRAAALRCNAHPEPSSRLAPRIS